MCSHKVSDKALNTWSKKWQSQFTRDVPRNSSHSADHSSHTASDRDANFQQQTFACSAGNCLMALQQTQLLCSKPVLLAVQQTCTACFAANLYCLLCSKPVLLALQKACVQRKAVHKKTSGKQSKPAIVAVIELPQDGACKLVATRIVVLCSNDTCTTAESQQRFFCTQSVLGSMCCGGHPSFDENV